MSKRRSKRRSAEEYRQLLARREREGLTFPQLSRRTGVPLSTLQEWSRKFRRAAKSARPGFVEVVEDRPKEVTGGRIEIVVRGGRRLRVSADTATEDVRELVLLLESC